MGNTTSNFVSSISFVSVVSLSYIIREFRLVEVRFTIVSIPKSEISKSMLSSKTVSGNVISINNKTILYWVSAVVNESSSNFVISSPEPGIINDDITRVNLNHILCHYTCRCIGTSDSSINVRQNNWIGCATCMTLSTNIKQCWRVF